MIGATDQLLLTTRQILECGGNLFDAVSLAVKAALFTAVSDCKARFVLISYSSEGFISHETFLKEMNALGRLTVVDTPYNTFPRSRNLSARSSHVVEYLYLLDRR